MPIIPVRPSLADYDHQPETATGTWRGLTLRVRVAVKRDALLRELAAGAPPGLSPELALRASRLVKDRHRHQLARSLCRAIREAHEPPMTRSSMTIVDRRAVIDAEVALDALITRISSDRPVAAQGMAMVEWLITDGVDSPLYNDARPGTLSRHVSAARIALEPEPESGEFPVAA
jgi:hypothetical protein